VTDRIPSLRCRRLVLAAALLAALAAALPAIAAEGEKLELKSMPGAPIFFNMRPIVLPVVVGNSIPRQVGILLTVELGDGHAQSEVRAKDRQLTDAFITELYRIYGWRSGDSHVVNEHLIKDRLQIVADRVLGKGVVDAILIRQLIEEER
jgi:flagellar protein FliL